MLDSIYHMTHINYFEKDFGMKMLRFGNIYGMLLS